MNPSSWANPNLGKTVLSPQPPHGIPGQCVNAASSWSLSIKGPELMGATAYQIWLNFRNPFFQVITMPIGLLPGDIVFFQPSNASLGTGAAGHVDVCVDSITQSGFRGADADWNGLALKYVNHSLTGVLGIFRPKGVDMITAGDVDKVFKMGLHRDPTSAELNNLDYQNNPSLLIETVWNNGGEQLFNNPVPNATELGPGTYHVG